jgi:hypothetical protein
MVLKFALPSSKGPLKQNSPAKFHHEHMPPYFSSKLICQKTFQERFITKSALLKLRTIFQTHKFCTRQDDDFHSSTIYMMIRICSQNTKDDVFIIGHAIASRIHTKAIIGYRFQFSYVQDIVPL